MIDFNLPMRTYRSTILSYGVSFCSGSRSGAKGMDHRTQPTPAHQLAPTRGIRTSTGVPERFLFASCWFCSCSLPLPLPSPRIGCAPAPSLGVDHVRLAVPDFKPSTGDPQNDALLKTFNDTFWNDLDNSGVVELVSKSFYPLQVPGQPPEVTFGIWNSPPPNAAMLAFGNLGVATGKVTVQGWLYDVKNTARRDSRQTIHRRCHATMLPASSPTNSPMKSFSAWEAASPASPRAKSIL